MKEIYQQLKNYYQNKPETPDFETQFSAAIDELGNLISDFEDKRAVLMENFKNELRGVIDKFSEERFAQGMEKLIQGNQENEENWKECEPRMEALTQIKNIFRSSFNVHRRKHQ